MKFTQTQIESTLRNLGIKTAEKVNNGGWLSFICQAHNDSNLNSSFCNVETGIIKCHVCNTNDDHIIKLVRSIKGFSFDEAIAYIGIESDLPSYYRRKQTEDKEDGSIKEVEINSSSISIVPFDPDKYYYTRERGFTEAFMQDAGIGRSYGNLLVKKGDHEYEFPLDGYMAIPLPELGTWEFRKLLEWECLSEILPETKTETLKEFRNAYAQLPTYKQKMLKYRSYLFRPRVYYPDGSLKDKSIIFNQSKLDREKDLYIREGITGTARIWSSISKNVTATFGSQVTAKQIQVLSEFQGRKIIVPDGDTASINMVDNLSASLERVFVACIETDDTDKNFIKDIKDAEIIEGARYVIRKRKGK